MTTGSSSKINIAFNAPSNFKGVLRDRTLTLTWTDPEDLILAEQTIDTWVKTVLVQSTSHIPTSSTDGTIILTETTKNMYQTSGYTISGLNYDTTYYYSLFAFGSVTQPSSAVSLSKTPSEYRIMTVKIDQTNSNPSTCCTYADDAITMTAGSDEWDEFVGARPCIFQNGAVVGYLNPNDFTKYENGDTAPITDTNYDVMIEFPRRGLKIETDSNDIITISVTDNPNDEDFEYLAHKRGSTQKDYFYLGAYIAYVSNSNVRSISGYSPTVSTSLTNFITYAHNNGDGYEIMGFYQWTYLQAMYLLKYKNLNSQTALGQGVVSGSITNAGTLNSNGMCYGTTSSTIGVKLFGIEHPWGNVQQWISGLYFDKSYNLLTTTDNFSTNTASSDWEYSTSSGLSNNISYNYITKVQGNTKTGFIPKSTSGGSSTTYFADYCHCCAGFFPYVGGYWNVWYSAGLFYCFLDCSAAVSASDLGSRAMYL